MSDWLRERVMNFTFARGAIQQVPSALPWFEKLIIHNNVGCVLELGTGVGSLSVMFGILCPDRVITCDREDRLTRHIKSVLLRLGVDCVRGDLYDEGFRDLLMILINQVRINGQALLLLCDGGDKHKDFAMYAPRVLPGDVVACHDLASEFIPERSDILQIADNNKLERILVEEMNKDKTRLAVYKKRTAE
ncbi:MAG: hypothetical protein GWN00_21250 [Aliifodinibius sp.]|nr:hypothetical protein [Fodinibius sp.]NIY27242.1 hypothetical protein [Fodinibius sp.]